MLKNIFQSGYLSIFFGEGENPLQIWLVNEGSGKEDSVRLIQDEAIGATVLELISRKLAHTYIRCPPQANLGLGIKLPHVVFLLKNLGKYVSFEITILDDHDTIRRFRSSSYQASVITTPELCVIPLRLEEGWNQVRLDLQDLVRQKYGRNFKMVHQVQVHATCRIRRIYFSDQMVFSEDELPHDFRLYQPKNEN